MQRSHRWRGGRITLARSVSPKWRYGKKGLALVLGIGAFDDAALAGHDGLAGTEVAPAGGDGEVVAGHVAAVGGGRHGDGGDLGAELAGGDAGDGCVGVQQTGQLTPAGGGDGQGLGGLFGRRGGSRTALAAMERVACRISRTAAGMGASRSAPTGEIAPTRGGRCGQLGPAGERDAGPFHAQRAGVGLAVGGVVQYGQHVVEEVLDGQVEAFQVAAGGRREIRAARVGRVGSQGVFAEPGGNAGSAAIHQVKAADVRDDLRRRPFPAWFLLADQPKIPG